MIVAAHRRIALAGAGIGSGGLGASALWLAFHGGGATVERTASVGAVLAGSLLALALGGGLGEAPPRHWPGWFAAGGTVGLAGFAALSVIWTGSPTLTVKGTAFLAFAVLVLVGSLAVFRGPALAATGVAAVVGVSVVIALVIEWHLLAGDRLTLFPYNRLSYPVDYGSADAALIFIGVPAAVGLATLAEASHAARAALAGAAGLMVSTGSLALSRGGTIALLISLAIVLALARSRMTALLMILAQTIGFAAAYPLLFTTERRSLGVLVGAAVAAGATLAAIRLEPAVARAWTRRRIRVAALIAVSLIAVAGAVAVATTLPSVLSEFRTPPPVSRSGAAEQQQRFNTQTRFTTAESTRWEYWKVALRTWKVHPLGGVGAGAFAIPWYQKRSILEGTTDAHGWPFQFAAEEGSVGVVLFLVVVGALVAAAVACRRHLGAHAAVSAAAAGSTGYFLVHAGVDWLFSISCVVLLGMTAAGALLGAATNAPRRLGDLRLHAGLGFVTLLALAVLVPVWVSLGYQSRAERQLDPRAVSESLRAARTWNPFSVEPLQIQAQVDEGAGRPAAAEADLRRAIRAEPTRWESWAELADLLTRRGKPAEAAAAGRRARALNPLQRSLAGY